MASHEDLDEDALCHCCDYTEALIQEGSLGDLWDDFGIVGELVVCESAHSLQHRS